MLRYYVVFFVSLAIKQNVYILLHYIDFVELMVYDLDRNEGKQNH